MAFTFFPSQIDPATGDPVSAVRWLIQDLEDTTDAPAEVSDEAIQALYDSLSTDLDQLVLVHRTGSLVATALWRRYSKQASFSSGGTSAQLGARAEAWRKVADDLAALALAAEGGQDVLGVIGVARDQPAHYLSGLDLLEGLWTP